MTESPGQEQSAAAAAMESAATAAIGSAAAAAVGESAAAAAVGSAAASAPAPRVSIIIPHLNTPEALVRCLQSLSIQTLDHGDFEILVIDNGSRMSLDPVAAAWPEVKFLREPTPGPGPARNLGVRHAAADILAFIDADCRADRGWLQAAVDAVAADPRRPAGGDVRVDFRDPAHVSGLEAFEAVFSFRQKMYIRRKHFSGAGNLACTRATFAAVGDFAGIEKSEDVDWGLRATAAGHPPRYVGAMRIFHPARQSLAALHKRWERFIAHKWFVHDKSLTGRIIWQIRALAVLLSPAAHGFLILASPRIPTPGGRLRAIPVLFATRIRRFREMQRVARTNDASSAQKWNRA